MRMQQRLVEMGFDPGVPDGVYGPATAQAVWAYQKLVTGATGKAVNGVITAQLWDRMQDPLGIGPRRPNATSTHMEIYLPEQVAILFQDNVPRLITHISSGSGKEWAGERKDGTKVFGTSITPGGTYKFNRRQSGWWEGDLGRMHNPVYFNYGIAVHGMTAVPELPGVARLRAHPDAHLRVLPVAGAQRRPGVRVGRREGAGEVRRPAAAVRPPRPHRDHHDGAAHDGAAGHTAAHRGARDTGSDAAADRHATTPPPATAPPDTTAPPASSTADGGTSSAVRRRPRRQADALQGRRSAPPASGSTHCRAERVGARASASEPGDEDAFSC